MKLNFILLAIVIAFIICYCFSKKKKIQEGKIKVAPKTSGGILSIAESRIFIHLIHYLKFMNLQGTGI